MTEIDAGEVGEADGSSGVAGGALQLHLHLAPAPVAPGGAPASISGELGLNWKEGWC